MDKSKYIISVNEINLHPSKNNRIMIVKPQ